MEKELLSLDHMDLLQRRLRSITTCISEYSFPNLYLFRKNHEYRVLAGDDIFILGKTYDGLSFAMPTRDLRGSEPRALADIIKDHGALYPIPEEWLDSFPSDLFLADYHDNDSDYIHYIEKLISYKGKKLHGKKNLLNQFLNRYEHCALPLTDDLLGDALKVLEDWQASVNDAPEHTDYYQCREAIELYGTLSLCGGIYYVDGAPAGFIIGEELNDKVFALHFAKGNRAVKGLYQFMYSNFAGIMPSKYCCFNFEQDLGKESLRQAKSTYEPEHLVKKYRIILK